MFAFEKTAEKVARDLVEAIFRNGYYVQVRCVEEHDLLQTPTADRSKALEAIFSVEGVSVEAVTIDPENMKREVAARFLCIDQGTGSDLIADHTASDEAQKIYRRAIA